MAVLDDLGSFLTDPNIKNNVRVGRFLAVILLAFVINDITGFSYFYNLNSKVEILKELGQLKSIPANVNIANELDALGKEALAHRNIFESTYSNLISKQSISEIRFKNTLPSVQNGLLFHLSAGGLFYFAAIFVIPIIFVAVKDQGISQKLTLGGLLLLVLFFIGFLFSYLLGLIPVIFDQFVGFNYIINVVLQLGFFFLLSLVGKRNRLKRQIKTQGA